MNVDLAKYRKTIAFIIGAVVTIGGVVLSQHLVTGKAEHWVTVVVSAATLLGTGLGVYGAPNRPQPLGGELDGFDPATLAPHDPPPARTELHAEAKPDPPASVNMLHTYEANVIQSWEPVGTPAAGVLVKRLPLHPKLGRHVRHDPRSRRYAVAELPKSAIKPVHWTRRVPVFDQGQLGSCTGNAAAGWLATDDIYRNGLTQADGKPVDETLAVSIYSQATKLDDISGSYPPDDTGSDGLSVAKVLQAHGWCGQYQHAFSADAAYSALQSGPVLVGIPWLGSMFDTKPDGHIVVDKASKVDGGHEFVVDQIDVNQLGNVERVWMTNSWGPSFGVGGRGYFTDAEFRWLLSQQGDVTVPIAVAAPIPSPDPTPEGDAFTNAVASFPGLAAWLAKNAAAHKANGQPLSPAQYAAWKLAGSAHLR